jgi:hypothetical protein
MFIRLLLATVLVLLSSATVWAEAPDIEYQDRWFMDEETIENLIDLNGTWDYIIGIEVINIQPDNRSLQGKFGHTLLRFVDDNGQWHDDIVLNFNLKRDNISKFSYRKAITGGYPMVLQAGWFSDFWLHYTKERGRSMFRHILLTTPEQRKSLIDTIIKWARDPEKNFRSYTFTGNNCATIIRRLFKDAGLPYKRVFNSKSPNRLNNYLENLGLTPFPPLRNKSSRDLFNLFSDRTVHLVKNVWTEEDYKDFKQSYTVREIKDFIYFQFLFPAPYGRRLLEEFGDFEIEGYDWRTASSITNVPHSLYNFVTTQEEASAYLKSYEILWGEQRDPGHFKRKRSLPFNVNWRGQKDNIDQHYKLLQRAQEAKELSNFDTPTEDLTN